MTTPISIWLLDEVSDGMSGAVARVDSQDGNDLTDSGTLASTTDGTFGEVAAPASNYLYSATDTIHAGATGCTFCGWLQIADAGAHGILGRWGGGGTEDEFLLYSGDIGTNILGFSSKGSSEIKTAAATFGAISTGTWYFVCCGVDLTDGDPGNWFNWISVRQPGGDETGARDTSTVDGQNNGSSQPFYLGADWSSPFTPMRGQLHKWQFFDVPISYAEEAAIYAADLSGPEIIAIAGQAMGVSSVGGRLAAFARLRATIQAASAAHASVAARASVAATIHGVSTVAATAHVTRSHGPYRVDRVHCYVPGRGRVHVR